MTTPYFRPRRLRDNPILRDAIAETRVALEHLVYPMFVADLAAPHPVTTMPGVVKYPIAALVAEVEALVDCGLRSFILFGTPDHKDSQATPATAKDGVVPRALRAIRKAVGNRALIATDVCLCSYTDSGHCGVLDAAGRVDNDASIELIAQTALAHAEAGADLIAPSDMMDGRIGRIRERLDRHGLTHVPIMSYAVKYASSLYGPFREAADCAPAVGDRRGYQMDFRNRRDALREAQLDEQEGADILMVKPGISHLDILRDLREATCLPLAAYQVSGEYAMIRYAAMAGAIDERAVAHELWTAMRRAGASLILTYHAAMAAREKWLP
jgi:porphobilinogen synthase